MSNEYAYSRGELIRIWPWTPGLRCVLSLFGTALELRVECEESVIRREFFFDLSRAVAEEGQWRLQYEMDAAAAELLRPEPEERCSECADAPVVEVDGVTGVRWLCCPSCGNVWITCERGRTGPVKDALGPGAETNRVVKQIRG